MRWLSRPLSRLLTSLVTATAITTGLTLAVPGATIVHASWGSAPNANSFCAQKQICADVQDPNAFGEYVYVGHDEPAVLFYSNTPGAGNAYSAQLTLPTDPPTVPQQNGSGGTFNFQLHPAFWFGMAMCDTQSAPEYTNQCTPDSDSNIFDSPDPSAPDYIGKHPGTAFMEMQFYPPGWAPFQLPGGISCDATRWCAALNIDSFSQDMNTGKANNSACLNTVGIEPVNFAFITRSGVAQAPANPVNATAATYTPDPKGDLFMNSGDVLTVDLHDTAAGFQVVIHDLTQGTSGAMTASPDNGFAQVVFDPNARTCTANAYAFHPMYSTSSEHTRVPWAAHSYSIAFSDEIGHFEYCNAMDSTGNCTSAGVSDPSGVDSDDTFCLSASSSTAIAITGCAGSDLDFDGVPYQDTWPGSLSSPRQNSQLNPSSLLFTSPRIKGSQPYSRVAFEADLPRIELNTNPPCDRSTGANCVNPPAGATFYPFYSTRNTTQGCAWQLGGANIPGTKETFGGSSTAEFGQLLQLAYPGSHFKPTFLYEDFRNILSSNPC